MVCSKGSHLIILYNVDINVVKVVFVIFVVCELSVVIFAKYSRGQEFMGYPHETIVEFEGAKIQSIGVVSDFTMLWFQGLDY